MTERSTRVYRNTGEKVMLALFLLGSLILVSSLILSEVDEHPSAWFALLLILPLVILVGLSFRSRLVVVESGVVVVNPYKTRRLEWNEIASFEARRVGPYGLRLLVHLTDGSWVHVVAMECGWGRPCRELRGLAESLTNEVRSHHDKS